MRFDTCQEIGHFHMLIHFTLTLTPGGWDISHVMNGRKKRTQEVQHLIHGQAPFTQKSGKRRPTHPAACPFYRPRALLSHLYPHGNIP